MRGKLLNAQIIYTSIARLAGIYLGEPPKTCGQPLSPMAIILKIYDVRKGVLDRDKVLKDISCTLAEYTKEIDASTIGLSALSRKSTGFHELVVVLHRLYDKQSESLLKQAITLIAGEITSACRLEPSLEKDIKRIEKRMKLYGAILGLLLPLLFILTLYANAVIGIVAIIVATGLWLMIRREGHVYRTLYIEALWRRCALPREAIKSIVEGRTSLPTIFELLGIPPPRLD